MGGTPVKDLRPPVKIQAHNPNRQGENGSREAFESACLKIENAANDGQFCEDLDAAQDVLCALEKGVVEARAAIRKAVRPAPGRRSL